MTYRERRLAKAERLREWADKREKKSATAFQSAERIASGIPMGQPILVGHHSERRHRRDLDRIHNGMSKGVEHSRMADSMNSRAANIDAAADRAIYRDDPDAIERLTAKLETLEAQRARMNAANKAYRKGSAAYAAYMGITAEAEQAIRAKIEAGYSWCRQPHPGYELQNIGGTITKERKRLAEFTAAKTSAGSSVVAPAGETATARAGLVITATMTTPHRAGKKPRPVWNVSGNLAFWRPLLVESLGGSWYHGVVSFWDDPAEAIEAACRESEAQ
jgi:hypothetical protein